MLPSEITKSKTILEHTSHGVYRSKVEDPSDRYTVVTLDSTLWTELGQPNIITVTIEPGDKLNSSSDGSLT